MIFPTGEVQHFVEEAMLANCDEVDLADFWGPQTCKLVYRSWNYNGYEVTLEVFDNQTEVAASWYAENSPVEVRMMSK